MDKTNSEGPIKQISISKLKIDPTAKDLIDSSAMEPYVELALAVMGHNDTGPAGKEIAALPLEKADTWRQRGV